MNNKNFGAFQISHLLKEYSYVADFFSAMALPLDQDNMTLEEYFHNLDSSFLENIGVDREDLIPRFDLFMSQMADVRKGVRIEVASVTVLGGHDKSGIPENMSFTMNTGDIICIVGPTGSGKSRLLADIEWMAREDTPTGRRVLINGQVPPLEWRFSLDHKLVAQLSQNMNFIVDMSAYDFVQMHAESRMIEDSAVKTEFILHQANLLAGEPFSSDTPVTSLSGGQSRALMIADTAFLSTSPIILIDEIENAGIDRKTALNLLVKEEKIVMIATHDPLLALMGHRRIVVRNGGIKEIIDASPEEKANLAELERVDRCLAGLRDKIRSGTRIDFDLRGYF
jgi:ABC-type lipoprotein export system ATPase subunit